MAPRRRAQGKSGMTPSARNDLQYAWRHRRLVLFLGAGVSVPYGLPSWQNLVLELLFEQAQHTKRLGPMWPHYRRAVASWMADYFDYNPLVLARVVEHYLAKGVKKAGSLSIRDTKTFVARLQTYLYANRREPTKRSLLQAIADLIARSKGSVGIDTVVTFNFDDLLEQELARRRVRFTTVASPARQKRSSLRIIHAHGFIPRKGDATREDLVFTEPDYHRLTESVFHWSLSEIVERLRKSTVLFVGLSMSDPSLRRLLDASRNDDIPPHYQLQKRHEVRDQEMLAAMADVERRARKYAETLGMGFDENKRPAELEDAVRAALRQADTYDREVFESMGVKTIWVDSFDEMPGVIDKIAPRRSRPKR
jgi:SIR2-like domain